MAHVVNTPAGRPVWQALQLASANPGKMYNAGNVIALLGAIAGFLLLRPGQGQDLTLWQYFFGNLAAVTTSLATLVFWLGGQKYAAAWARGFPPDQKANASGHMLSTIGAVLIGVALVALAANETALALAIIATILHVGGKLGSWLGEGHDRHFKPMPFYSRVPYLATLLLDMKHGFSTASGLDTLWGPLVVPAALVLATAFWARADWLLLDQT